MKTIYIYTEQNYTLVLSNYSFPLPSCCQAQFVPPRDLTCYSNIISDKAMPKESDGKPPPHLLGKEATTSTAQQGIDVHLFWDPSFHRAW